jgi:hypothetical protein
VPLLQHAPLHGCVVEQLAVQVLVDASQASPVRQSVATAQPHAPFDSHTSPVDELAQSTQVPLAPHAFCAEPGAHAPVLQQPPLHGSVAEQVVEQSPVDGSHA